MQIKLWCVRTSVYKVIRARVAVIELACGEYGQDKVDKMVRGSDNGLCLKWFMLPDSVQDSKTAGMDTQVLLSNVTIHLMRTLTVTHCWGVKP